MFKRSEAQDKYPSDYKKVTVLSCSPKTKVRKTEPEERENTTLQQGTSVVTFETSHYDEN